MKRILVLLAMLVVASASLADDPKPDTYNTTREFKSRVFEIQNRSPRDLATALILLGSGFKGAGLNVNDQLRTITVRDFPENIATIEEAIKRLDKPAPPAPDIELTISVLIGSKSPIANVPPIPDDLVPVVKELQSTLRYSNYALMTATVHHAKPGVRIENSGVAERTALGMSAREDKPVMYNYEMRELVLGKSGDRQSFSLDEFKFNMRVPIDVGTTTQYQNVGFATPLTVRDGERVVVGTTTMGEKALIVVVSAKFGKVGG